VIFTAAEFSGSTVSFGGARFSGGRVNFTVAGISGAGDAVFSGGTVDFTDPADPDDWSVPPTFPWTDTDTPPPAVKLPRKD
jgi:hypothetical protein